MPTKILFTRTGEVRKAREGDWLTSAEEFADGGINAWLYWDGPNESINDYVIWRRVEE